MRVDRPKVRAVSIQTSSTGARQVSFRLNTDPSIGDESQKVGIDWADFLQARADEFHLPQKELVLAVEDWTTHVRTSYQKGLAALYRENYASAAESFHQALDDDTVPVEQLYMSVAFAEFKRGNFSESSSFLEKLSLFHPQDSIVQRSLDVVRHDSAKASPELERVDKERLQICRDVMSEVAKGEAALLRSRFNSILAEAASDEGVGHLFDRIYKSWGSFKLVLRQSKGKTRGGNQYLTVSEFDKGEVEMVLSFDAENLISDIEFRDGKQSLSFPHP
jgi:hypothetical protein